MGWMRKWKGKYVTGDPDIPSPIGVCDMSGFVFNHKDLCMQMEWKGNRLVWTGLMVGKPFMDKPNEQNRPPLAYSDPTAVKHPRPPAPFSDFEYPVMPEIGQLKQELLNNSFKNIKDENVPFMSSDSISEGFDRDYRIEPYPQLIAKLRKVSFSE